MNRVNSRIRCCRRRISSVRWRENRRESNQIGGVAREPTIANGKFGYEVRVGREAGDRSGGLSITNVSANTIVFLRRESSRRDQSHQKRGPTSTL